MAISFRSIGKRIRNPGRNRMPFALFIGEILLLIMIVRNFYNFTIFVTPQDPSFTVVLFNFISIGMCGTATIFAVNGILGISSSRPKSWRKLARSGITMILLNVLYWFLGMFGFVHRSVVISGVAMVMIVLVTEVIVFLPSVRRYYTPPLHEVPPIKAWLKFIVATPLLPADTYELAYSEDGEDVTLF